MNNLLYKSFIESKRLVNGNLSNGPMKLIRKQFINHYNINEKKNYFNG